MVSFYKTKSSLVFKLKIKNRYFKIAALKRSNGFELVLDKSWSWLDLGYLSISTKIDKAA